MSAFELRPLSLGELLDRAFLMYRRYILLFLGIAAIPQVLSLSFGLAQIFFFPVRRIPTLNGRTVLVASSTGMTGFLITTLGIIIAAVVYTITQGGTIAAVTELYLGRKATIADSLRRAWDEIGTLFATAVLNGLAVGVGFIALVIPGAYVLCRLIVCLPAALVESRSARDSVARSWELTGGCTGRSFVLLLIYFALVIGMGLLVGFPIGLGLASATTHSGDLRIWLALQQVATALIGILVRPFLLIGISIFYFDLRVRKEAFDLQFMMDPNSEHLVRGSRSGLPSMFS